MCRQENFVSAWNGFGFEHGHKDGGEWPTYKPTIQGIENQFVRSQGQFALSTCLFVKGSRDALLKFTGRVDNVSSIKSKIVQVNHQFKVFRDMIFGPIFGKTVILQIPQADLIDAQEGNSNVLQPLLGFAECPNAATLTERLTSQKDRLSHQRRMAPQNGAQQVMALIQSI